MSDTDSKRTRKFPRWLNIKQNFLLKYYQASVDDNNDNTNNNDDNNNNNDNDEQKLYVYKLSSHTHLDVLV